MKCPCCGREMKDTSYTMLCLWEEDYPEECIRYQCKACNVTYESGDWHIPLELEPTEKQTNAVLYIISRLNNAAEIPYPATKKNYWEFINKNLEKAKKALKITYNFDCHCCVEGIEISIHENATNEQIERAIFDDIVSKYANNFNWKKEKKVSGNDI